MDSDESEICCKMITGCFTGMIIGVFTYYTCSTDNSQRRLIAPADITPTDITEAMTSALRCDITAFRATEAGRNLSDIAVHTVIMKSAVMLGLTSVTAAAVAGGVIGGVAGYMHSQLYDRRSGDDEGLGLELVAPAAEEMNRGAGNEPNNGQTVTTASTNDRLCCFNVFSNTQSYTPVEAGNTLQQYPSSSNL